MKYIYVILSASLLFITPLFAQEVFPNQSGEITRQITRPTLSEDKGASLETVQLKRDESMPPAGEKPPPMTNDETEVNGQVTGVITGRILEKGTKRPLEKITFYIKEKDLTLNTDDKGWFSFKIQPGEYTVIIPVVGYEKFETSLSVEPNQKQEVNYRLIPEVVNPFQIVVRSQKTKSAVSVQKISIEEATLTPGSNRDVLSVVSNLPGVSPVSVFGGYSSGFAVRGSAPDDSLIYIRDNVIPLLYHFGELESIIEPELVESVDFDAGGFSAEYGEATGGVISVNLKEPKMDRLGGYVNLGLLSSSFMVEGPITEKDSFAFAVKRGLIDVYVKLALDYDEELADEVNFVEYPTYYDGSFLYKHDFSKQNNVSVFGILASEGTEVKLSREVASPRLTSRLSDELFFFNLIGQWEYKKGPFISTFSPMVGLVQWRIDGGPQAYFDLTYNQIRLSEKIEYKINETHRLISGGRLVLDSLNLDASLWHLPKEGESFYNPFETEYVIRLRDKVRNPSVYLMDQMTIGRFLITPGLHYHYDSHNKHGYGDPRILGKYNITDQFMLKAAVGLYSKTPPFDETYEPLGIQGLKPERSVHYVGGAEYRFTDNLSLDVQGYYKTFYDMAVRTSENDLSNYENKGKGYAYGGEFFLRHKMTDKFFGWLSYSYSVSKREGSYTDLDTERLFTLDVPHSFRAVFSYKLTRTWTVGIRYEFASGTPYTDLLNVPTFYDVDNNIYIPVYFGPVNGKRLPAHHQVDIRVDKLWLFNKWVLSTYIDARNVFRNDHVIAKEYNEDYTEAEDQLALESIIPLVFWGAKIDF